MAKKKQNTNTNYSELFEDIKNVLKHYSVVILVTSCRSLFTRMTVRPYIFFEIRVNPCEHRKIFKVCLAILQHYA